MKTAEKIEFFLKKGILLSPESIEDVDESIVDESTEKEVVVLDKKKILELRSKKKGIPKVQILYNYTKESGKRTFQDFVSYFNNRFKTLEKMLKTRPELERLTSIQRVKSKKDRERVSVIGIISKKSETKNNNIILEVEDTTGKISVLISKNKDEIYKEGRDLVLDEVIGITGVAGDDIVFAESITFPDVPVNNVMKKGQKETYAMFVSDIEVGSKNFLKEEFEKFISWIQGRVGDEEQKRVASKLEYLFIVGDLVAGVGVYPGQEDELEITDIKEQYALFAEYLKRIPSHINIIICPGNHDAGRITEPQPPLYKDFAESIYDLPNVILVSNPSLLKIEETETFEGFDVLLYHGYSMPYFADHVESIRAAGGQKRPDLILEFYMKRRHLAPSHTSNMYLPDTDHDPMLIEKIPDFLATGHIHRTGVHNYKGITLMNCSAWTKETEYQAKRGLTPQPGRAILVNLKSRKINIMKFVK